MNLVEGMSRILHSIFVLAYGAISLVLIIDITKEGANPFEAAFGIGILVVIGIIVWHLSRPIAKFVCQSLSRLISWISDGFRKN